MTSIIHPWLTVVGLVLGIVLGVALMRGIYRIALKLSGESVARALLVIVVWCAALVGALWLEYTYLFEAYLRIPTATALGSMLLVTVLTTLVVPFVSRGYYDPGWPSVRRALERAGATKNVARALAWGAWLPCLLSFMAIGYPIMVLMQFHDIL